MALLRKFSGSVRNNFKKLALAFIAPPWLSTIGDPDIVTPQPNIGDNTPHGSFLDSTGNLYVTGSSRGSTNATTVPYVVKYDPSGVILWQYTYSTSGVGYSITGNSAGNIFLVAYTGGVGTLYTLNTSGDIVSQIGLSVGDPREILVASNGELVIMFESSEAFTGIARLNSNATSVIFSRNRNTNQNIQFHDIAIANSGNIYMVGQYNFGGGAPQWIIVKYDSSGTIVWSRRSLYYGTGQAYLGGIAIDSSENLYVTGQNGNNPTARLNKVDSSGNFVWGKTIDVGCQVGSVAVDSTGSFIYVTGTRGSAYRGQYICKFDSSGTIQYQRTLQYNFSPEGNVQMQGPNMPIRLDSNYMYIALRADIGQYGSGEFVVEKLPLDGSKTGTYTLGGFTVTYAASSLTIGDRAETDIGNTDYSDTAGSLTLPSRSNSRANVSLTTSTTTL